MNINVFTNLRSTLNLKSKTPFMHIYITRLLNFLGTPIKTIIDKYKCIKSIYLKKFTTQCNWHINHHHLISTESLELSQFAFFLYNVSITQPFKDLFSQIGKTHRSDIACWNTSAWWSVSKGSFSTARVQHTLKSI